MILSTLFKQTKTGKVQQYNVSTLNDVVTVTQGQVEGLKQSYTTICTPKNVGRSNETSGAEQAELEAESKHAKKLKAGYTLNPTGEITKRLPQRVKIYQDQLNNVQDEVYTSEKLDGVNGTYRIEEGRLNLYSRGGELYPEIPHLTDDIYDLLFDYDLDELNLELYIENTPLQHIQSAVKKPKELSRRIEARIFEVPNVDGNYTSHLAKMETINVDDMEMVSIIPVRIARSKEEIDQHYDDAMANGAEGLIIRNPDGVYVHNQRSSDVFKYKKAQDAEFQISDYTLDKNGHMVMLCHTEHGSPFKVKMKGTNLERLTMAEKPEKVLDKWITVEYECLSEPPRKVPLKPVGIRFRKMDNNGQPLE